MPSSSPETSTRPPPMDGLLRAPPSARDLDADALAAFFGAVRDAGLELHACMLWRDGAVVFEGWRWPYRADRLRMTHSVTKSITACAIGLLIDEGRLALDDLVCSFFPEVTEVSDPRVRKITVEDLLTMRTGHGEEVSGSVWRGIRTSWLTEFFRIPIVHEPGTTHVYSSAASYMLSAIVTRITGETLHAFLKPRLFEPLGIVDETWGVGPDGFNPGGNGVSLTLADSLKLGILHAQGGVWNGKRLLPAWWVEKATQPQGSPEYGYHWPVGDGYYAALGVFVQMVVVFPATNTVLAINAAMTESAVLFPFIKRYLAEAWTGVPSAAADARLLAAVADWPTPPPLASTTAADVALIDGTHWTVEPNALGVRALSFETDGRELVFAFEDADGRRSAIVGLDSWREGVGDLAGASLHHGYALAGAPIVAGARWTGARELELVVHYVETAFRDTLTVRFEGDRLTLDRTVNINSSATAWPTLRAVRSA